MFGRAGDIGIGVVCTLLAAVLILPIPLGNLLPAIAVVLLGMSLTQRDGALTLAGYTVSAVSFSVLILSGHLVARAVARLGRMIGWW
jgi:hypothetical protein